MRGCVGVRRCVGLGMFGNLRNSSDGPICGCTAEVNEKRGEEKEREGGEQKWNKRVFHTLVIAGSLLFIEDLMGT